MRIMDEHMNTSIMVYLNTYFTKVTHLDHITKLTIPKLHEFLHLKNVKRYKYLLPTYSPTCAQYYYPNQNQTPVGCQHLNFKVQSAGQRIDVHS